MKQNQAIDFTTESYLASRVFATCVQINQEANLRYEIDFAMYVTGNTEIRVVDKETEVTVAKTEIRLNADWKMRREHRAAEPLESLQKTYAGLRRILDADEIDFDLLPKHN